ncbi:flagellar protein FlaG [Bacillaceae bacterium CLA-AA-H227]|uniref:Flagellar protein FlaG n=1 Tax=Robertmurraya yapensis (ex Hitch et al 2024) TaxID=3133160 RepID=A0ACC6SCA6_9BACI
MKLTSQTQVDITKSALVRQETRISTDSVFEEALAPEQQAQMNDQPSIDTVKKAVNEVNEFLEIHNQNSKFVFHEELERYYVQIVDADTDKVIKEIPPKKLLDGYYAMQKFIGIFFDEKV